MSDPVDDAAESEWALFALRVHGDGVLLRLVRERDLPILAELQPADYEHDPAAEALPGQGPEEHRRRLVHQGCWRSLGTW